MKKLLCLVMCCLMFGLVLYNVDLVYGEIDKEKLKEEHRLKLIEEARTAVTDEMVKEFFNSPMGQTIKKNKNNYNSWRTKFKGSIEKLANTDDKYFRLKEIVNELTSMCLDFNKKFDMDRILLLCDEGIAIKDLSFFHYCKFFAYMRKENSYEYIIDEFNKIDDRLKVIIPDLYDFCAMARLLYDDTEGALKIFKEGLEKAPSIRLISNLEGIYRFDLDKGNTKECLELKKTLLILYYISKVKNK